MVEWLFLEVAVPRITVFLFFFFFLYFVVFCVPVMLLR